MKQGIVSLVIFTFVRKIEKPISFNANLLYWISIFNTLMCLLTILMIIAFVGNHPIKGWKIKATGIFTEWKDFFIIRITI